jgi:hypothetical protein
MATKLYIGNSPPVYTPATIRGAWNQTASSVVKSLGTALSGDAITSVAIAETDATDLWDVLLLRAISQPLAANVTIAGTLTAILGVKEANIAANDNYHIHAYVTTGDTDTPRGTLLADSVVASEWPTTAAGLTSGALALSSVAAQTGDRIVVEIGYQAQNTATTSYAGTLYYGNPAGASDLPNADTAVTTKAGTITISDNLTFAAPKSRVTAVYAELDITNMAPKSRVTAVYAELDISTVHPVITSLTPDSGAVGDSVVIAGANFGAAQGTGTVTFNGVAATATAWSDTEITVTVPVGVATGPVVVTNDDGYIGYGMTFTLTSVPVITGMSVAHGLVGDAVVITGTGFGAAQGSSTVTIGGVVATITSWADAQIVVTVPAGAVTGNLVVTTAGGADSEAFTIDSSSDPTAWPDYPVLRAYRINSGTIPDATGARIIRGKVIGSGDADAYKGHPIVRVVDIGSGPLNTHYGAEMARIYIIGDGDAEGYAGQETVQLFTVV